MSEWTAAQCAAAWGVKPRTWHSYVAREQAPRPVRHVGRTPLWDAAVVQSYPRPGRGTRIDLKETTMSRRNITDQVRAYLDAGDFGNEIDLDGVVEEIGDTYGYDLASIDTIDTADWSRIIQRHDRTA